MKNYELHRWLRTFQVGEKIEGTVTDAMKTCGYSIAICKLSSGNTVKLLNSRELDELDPSENDRPEESLPPKLSEEELSVIAFKAHLKIYCRKRPIKKRDESQTKLPHQRG